jgi:ribosomal protein S18 acetylase RimI-like enzyme
MEMIRIRPLTEADAKRWRDLRLRMLRENPEAFGSAYEDQAAWPLDRFAQRLREANTPDNLILGAFEGDALIGSVGMGREVGAKVRHKAGIVSVYVAPEARGRSVARALFDDIIARARTLPGLEQLYLGVGADNIAARSLYLSLGFEVYGLERHALKVGERYVDEELMVLWLHERPASGNSARTS